MVEGLSGRLKYQYLRQRSDLDPSVTNNSSNVQPTTGPVLFHGVRRRELRPEHGQARRRLEPDAAARHRHRRDVAQDRLQGPVLRPHRRQAPDLRRLDRLRRSRQAPRLGDRQLGQDPVRSGLPQHFLGSEPAAGRHADRHHVRLGHEEHPGQLAGRAAGGLGGHRQAAGHRAGQLAQHRRRGRLLVGQLYGCRRLHPARRNARSVGQLRDRQYRHHALPDQGHLQGQQDVERNGRLRVREIRLQRRPDAGLSGLLPLLSVHPGDQQRPVVQQQLEHRRLRQPELQEQHLLVDRDVQLRHATAAAGQDAGRGSAAGAGRRGLLRRRPRRRHRPPRRHPPRRCRRSRSTRRCCSTSTRRC